MKTNNLIQSSAIYLKFLLFAVIIFAGTTLSGCDKDPFDDVVHQEIKGTWSNEIGYTSTSEHGTMRLLSVDMTFTSDHQVFVTFNNRFESEEGVMTDPSTFNCYYYEIKNSQLIIYYYDGKNYTENTKFDFTITDDKLTLTYISGIEFPNEQITGWNFTYKPSRTETYTKQ